MALPSLTRLHEVTFEQLRIVSTATLTSQLLRHGFRNRALAGLTPMKPDLRMVGYAFTLRYAPSREDLDRPNDIDNKTNVQRLAVETIGADEILVIDARGNTRAGVLGDLLATRMQQRGAAGLVTDGAVRDSPSLGRLEFPIYSAGSHPNPSLVAHHPVDMNVPIGCAGVLVMPGDVVVGDGEAVVVIPHALAEQVAGDAFEQEQLEAFIHAKIQGGSSILGLYPPDEATIREYRNTRIASEP